MTRTGVARRKGTVERVRHRHGVRLVTMLACIAAVTGVGEGAEGSNECVVIDPALDCHEDYVSTASPSREGGWNLVTPRLSALSENGRFLYSADYGAGDVNLAVRDLTAREVAWEAAIDTGTDDFPTSLALADEDRLLVVTAYALTGSVSRAVTVGIDSSTGAELWRRETQAQPGETLAAAMEAVVIGQRVYLLEGFSFSTKTFGNWHRFTLSELTAGGGRLWMTTFRTPVMGATDSYGSPPRLTHVADASGRELLVTTTVVHRDSYSPTTEMVAIDAATGELRWWKTSPIELLAHRAVVGEGGMLFLAGVIGTTGKTTNFYGTVMRIDPATGEALWAAPFDEESYAGETAQRLSEPTAIAVGSDGFVTVVGRIGDALDVNVASRRKLARDCSDGFIKRFDASSGAGAGEILLPETGVSEATDSVGVGLPSPPLCPSGDMLFDLALSDDGETAYAVGRSSDEVGSRMLTVAARWPSAGAPTVLSQREFGARTSRAARATFVALNESHVVVSGSFELSNWERAVTSGGEDVAAEGTVVSAVLTYKR